MSHLAFQMFQKHPKYYRALKGELTHESKKKKNGLMQKLWRVGESPEAERGGGGSCYVWYVTIWTSGRFSFLVENIH